MGRHRCARAAASRCRRSVRPARLPRDYHARDRRARRNEPGRDVYPLPVQAGDPLPGIAALGHAAVLEVVEDSLAGDAPPEEQVRRFVQAFTAWHAWNHRSARVQQYELHGAPHASTSTRSEPCGRGLVTCSSKSSGAESRAERSPLQTLDTTALAILSLRGSTSPAGIGPASTPSPTRSAGSTLTSCSSAWVATRLRLRSGHPC